MTTTPTEPTDCQPPLMMAIAGLACRDGEFFALLERILRS
jgi:hypothetical protein